MVDKRYLDQFLMFYSQSEAGNGLTRGLETELSRRTYVRTRLDNDLAPAILEGRFSLVILTGNAGDGKTAFIQMVEKVASDRGAKIDRLESIGSAFHMGGRLFRTLHDGSVDSTEKPNLDMLAEFFSPFRGSSRPDIDSCLIVAMNEGKLLDFLSYGREYAWLSRTLLDYLRKDKPLPQDMVVVNLNLRSVVDASTELGGCLFDTILDRYVASEFWEACLACAAREKCPVKFNVDTFRYFRTDDLSGRDMEVTKERNEAARKARIRFKAVVQMLHFRKRVHITVRDLRSVLAFALFGKRTCSEIEDEIRSGESDFTERYYYNAIFNETEKDRILEYLREFDVGLAASPQIDSRLSFTRPMTSDFHDLFLKLGNSRISSRGRIPADEDDLLRLYGMRPGCPEERTPSALDAVRRYVRSMRRKLFFEGDREGIVGSPEPLWIELVPYDNMVEFISFIDTGQDKSGALKEGVVEGISRSEGIYDFQRGRENVCIRTRQDHAAKVKAFFTYPASDFKLTLPEVSTQADYVEYLPSGIVFRHDSRKVELQISLDLYEMLVRIRDGYMPTVGEMRTFFLNLLMFKKQLMSVPSPELLLTESDYRVFRLRRTPQNGVALSTL